MATENWMQPIKRFFRLLAEDKKDISNIYIFAVFSGLISLSLPLGVQAILNIIMGGRMSSSWVLLVAIVVLGTAMVGFLQILQLSVSEIIQQRIFVRSSFEFSYRIPRFKITEVMDDHPPELVNRFFDTLNVQKGLPKIIMDFPTALLQILFGLILLSFYHPLFILFGILLIGMLVLILYATGPQGLRTSLEESSYKYKVAHWLEELARTMYTFKLAGNVTMPEKRTDKLTMGYLAARKGHFKILISQFVYVVLFKTIITGGLLVIGGMLVINNQINIGQFVAAEIVIITILNSSEKLIKSLDTVYDVLTGLEKMGDVMDIPLDHAPENAIEIARSEKGIGIELVDFKLPYPVFNEPVLQNINLKINPGEKVCISGKEGSGKTVLLQSLGTFYTEYLGAILFNGHPLGSIDLGNLRGLIGDNFTMEDMFDGTLAENVGFGKPEVTNMQIMSALQLVGLSDFVKTLPNGLLTHIEPGGKKIPVGIVKRIILSRSFAHNPAILLLDNFPFGEDQMEELTEKISVKFKSCTAVLVSNQKSVAQKCNRIIIMDAGAVVFDGSWAEVQKIKEYADLYVN